MMVVAGGIFVSILFIQQSQFFFHVIVDICRSVQVVVTASIFWPRSIGGVALHGCEYG